jgi:hypothetical protein
MQIAGIFSFNGGEDFVKNNFPQELQEIINCINNIDAQKSKTKISKEKTMRDKVLYSPVDVNKQFQTELYPIGWKNVKESCDYTNHFYVNNYTPKDKKIYPYRDMDFVKNKLGVEVQFGKYSFMVYNVCAKMTIFRNLGHIQAGIEIVPIKELADEMSTGVSYFEQFVWDLTQRGVSNIDIPVMILGIKQ